jgi:hypothetical protein
LGFITFTAAQIVNEYAGERRKLAENINAYKSPKYNKLWVSEGNGSLGRARKAMMVSPGQ